MRRSEGWLLERRIPETEWRDAMGPYPLFTCGEWRHLAADMDDLRGRLVSVVLVADPMGDHDEALLRAAFPDLCRPYKKHFVVDLTLAPRTFLSEHHRRNIRKARRRVTVEVAPPGGTFLDEWCRLYEELIRRHALHGLSAFSREIFSLQFQVPGFMGLRALRDGEVVGAILFYRHGDTAWYHLGAYAPAGYESGASYALFAAAMEILSGQGVRWLALGGGAHVDPRPNDGLARFKQGWASGVRTAWICGRILDPERYRRLVGPGGNGFFPAYRKGEFS